MRTVQARHVLDIDAVASGWNVVTVTAGPDFEPIVLCSDRPVGFQRREPYPISWRKKQALLPTTYRIWHQALAPDGVIVRPEKTEHFAEVQPLGNDEWLLVGAGGSLAQPNGHVYRSDGSLARSFSLDERLADVQATSDGFIWVSHNDESAASGGEDLICFNRDGARLFNYFYDIAKPNGIPFIDDCYALNVVSDHDVWLYYYSDFPLVHLHDRTLHSIWRDVPIRGAHAFAVAGGQALFAVARASGQPGRLFLLDLGTMQQEEVMALDDSGATVSYTRAFARGARLYLRTAAALYVVEMDEL